MSGSGEESTSSSVQMSGSGVQDGDASETDNEKGIHDSVDKEENATCRLPSNPPNGSVAVASPRRGFYVAINIQLRQQLQADRKRQTPMQHFAQSVASLRIVVLFRYRYRIHAVLALKVLLRP